MTPDAHPTEIVEAEGHLVDSGLLSAIFDKVIASGGAFEVVRFDLGQTNDEFSRLTLKVTAPNVAALDDLLEELVSLGCRREDQGDALVRPADRDGCAPEDFYSTTNQRTEVRVMGGGSPSSSSEWMPRS